MNVVQNEFILLTNAYYQAHAYSQNMIASGIFGNIAIQPEFNQFREQISQTSDTLLNLVEESDRNGNKGEADKMIMKMKMTEIFKVSDNFLEELENSINKLKSSGGDMTAYRISFQMGSDYIYQFVGGTISNFGGHVDLREGIFNIIDSILNQNYWEGEELKQQITFIKNLRDGMNYSENWIKEYAYRMFAN
jgi:hypothetical protein